MLETAPRFNEHSANLIKDFIEHQPQPVCLIAHNGLKFDVPVLKKVLGVHIQVNIKYLLLFMVHNNN